MKTYAANNTHGKKSIPGMDQQISERKVIRIRKMRELQPKAKNGITDPFSYLHILDAVLSIHATELFTAKQVCSLLSEWNRPIEFDPVTVGRILKDIAESLDQANKRKGIFSNRWWDGTRYWTSNEIEDRVAMENLLDDLALLCESDEPSNSESPLYRCPSVTV